MAKKKGRSEKKTGFFGGSYIQHYDSSGKKSGRSLALFARRSQSCVVMLSRHNTKLRKVFPRGQELIWIFVGARFGNVQLFSPVHGII